MDSASSTILVVDDDQKICKVLVRLLASMGHRAEYVTSGAALFEYLRRSVPNLILLDIMMPDMNGIEVLRELRANPLTERLPVIMHSALSDSEMEMRTRELGVADFWVKSIVDVISMENSLRRHLGKAA